MKKWKSMVAANHKKSSRPAPNRWHNTYGIITPYHMSSVPLRIHILRVEHWRWDHIAPNGLKA